MVDQHPPGSPLWWLAVLDGQLRKRQRDLKRWDRYFSGAHPMAFATAKYREAFADLLKPLADNWTPLIVRAVRERLHVDGFRYGEDPSADGDANYFWQANGLDFESGLAHTEALVGGVCYGLVDPTVRIGAQAAPQVTIEHPSQVIVATSPESRRVRLAGLKRWRDDFGRELATVYLPEQVFRYERQLSAGRWVARSDGDAEVGNPFGVVPLVPLERRERLLKDPVAEFDNVIPLQDACNKLVADMMVAAEFAAFFQRWATGVEPVKDADGNDVLPFSVGADRMFWSENHEARFGQFQASDLNNYVVAIEMVVQHMAALSSTPPHYLLGKMANLSGDALAAAETGLVSKCLDRQRGFEESWEEIIRLCFAADGDPRASVVDAETIWRDAEHRTEAEQVDAAIKRLQFVPVEQVWLDAGYTPRDVVRFKAMLRDQALERMLTGAVPLNPVQEARQALDAVPVGAASSGG